VSWWCVPLREPWHWQWKAYPGVWLLVASLVATRLAAARRPAGRRGTGRFVAGAAALWLVSDWPLGTLAAGYLASAHMVQWIAYVFVAAPLLVLGTPEALARRWLSRLRANRLVRAASRPFPAAVAFNAITFATHAPVAVDTLRTGALGGFALDMAWLLSGLLLWLPVCGPLPELRPPSHPLRIAYLWFAAGFLTWVPGSFLVFASFPLYRTYELAPRALGLDAGTDQLVAGLVMKLGTLPFVWGPVASMWWAWARAERAGSPSAVEVAERPAPA
jgi:putative membrane protein